MTKHDQRISREGRGEEQPKDKDRARNAPKTEPGHMPPQRVEKERPDEQE